MIIYCKDDRNTNVVPNAIPFGSANRDVIIYIPKMVATVSLHIAPPDGTILQPIFAAKATDDGDSSLFVAKLPQEVTASVPGRVGYQVEVRTIDDEVITYERGSFNIQKGVPVEIPKSVEELKDYTIESLYDVLTRYGSKITEVGNFVGTDTDLATTAKTVVGAINELKTEWVGGGNGAPVDPSLENEGYAADAKATGDKIKEVNGLVANLGTRVDDVEQAYKEEDQDIRKSISDINGTLSNVSAQAKQNDEDIENLITRVEDLENTGGTPGGDGADGRGIDRIEKVGSNGLKDHYRIYFTDNGNENTEDDHFDYYVTNGAPGKDGQGFRIARIYQSVADMEADFNNDNIVSGEFVLINNDNVNDPDNSKLYVKSDTGFSYLTDLSGAQGIQGVGVKSFDKTASSTEEGWTEYTMTFTDGDSFSFKVYDGKDADPAKITAIENRCKALEDFSQNATEQDQAFSKNISDINATLTNLGYQVQQNDEDIEGLIERVEELEERPVGGENTIELDATLTSDTKAAQALEVGKRFAANAGEHAAINLSITNLETTKVDPLAARVDTLEDKALDAESRITSLESYDGTVQRALQDHAGDITTLQNETLDIQGRLSTLENNQGTVGGGVELDVELKDPNKAAPAKKVGDEFDAIQGNINALSGRAYNLEQRASALEAADTGIKARLDTLEQGGGTGGGSTVELDTTLTQQGKAADAKAVGDKINALDLRLVSVEVTDTTLTQEGKAANAKAVGEEFKKYATKTYVDSAVANAGGGGAGIGTYSAGLEYTLKDNGEYEVTGIGTCTDKHIVIPSMIGSVRVTSIGENAFKNCATFEGVTIPNSITSIGKMAFTGAHGLKSITIPSGVTSMGEDAFRNCGNLERVTIADGVTTIGSWVFCYCSKLASVTIPKSVTTIEEKAFAYSNSALKIYCEASSQPSGWNANWNVDNFPVTWGAALDFASVNGKLASGGASGGGIIDVVELPTTNIDENALYRVPLATLYFNGYVQGNTYVVNGLPSTGEPCTTDGQSVATTYYNAADNTLYGYVPSAVGAVLGVPAGWYPAATLLGALGYTYGGVIYSSEDMGDKDFYLLVAYDLYFHKNNRWDKVTTDSATKILKMRIFKTWDDVLTFCFSHHDIFKIRMSAGLKLAFVNDTNGEYIVREEYNYTHETLSVNSDDDYLTIVLGSESVASSKVEFSKFPDGRIVIYGRYEHTGGHNPSEGGKYHESTFYAINAIETTEIARFEVYYFD